MKCSLFVRSLWFGLLFFALCALQGCKQQDDGSRDFNKHGPAASDAQNVTLQHILASKCRKMWSEDLSRLNLVPFYVYDVVDWSKLECRTPSRSSFFNRIDLPDSTYQWNNSQFQMQVKHDDDIYFTGHALKHPARVFDPKLAKLFVIPGYFNQIAARMHFNKLSEINRLPPSEVCCMYIEGDVVCGEDLVRYVDERVKNSFWFQRNQGGDHVIVASHYLWGKDWDGQGLRCPIENYTMFRSSNIISFEENAVKNGRLRIASTYGGVKCDPVQQKTADAALIASLPPHKQRFKFEARRNICNWLANQNGTSAPIITTSICGQGEQCPALAQARIGFHTRGDTFGANRLMDTFLSETVPAFTEQEQYLVLPFFIPWRKMSVFVDVRSEQSFFDTLREALTIKYEPVRDFNRKANVSTFLDWQQVYLFENYMAAFASFVYDSEPGEHQLSWPNFTRIDAVPDEFLHCSIEQPKPKKMKKKKPKR